MNIVSAVCYSVRCTHFGYYIRILDSYSDSCILAVFPRLAPSVYSTSIYRLHTTHITLTDTCHLLWLDLDMELEGLGVMGTLHMPCEETRADLTAYFYIFI